MLGINTYNKAAAIIIVWSYTRGHTNWPMVKKKQSMDVWKPDLKSMTLQTIKEKSHYLTVAARKISCLNMK